MISDQRGGKEKKSAFAKKNDALPSTQASVVSKIQGVSSSHVFDDCFKIGPGVLHKQVLSVG
jgi:hypothetical protein